MFFGYTNGLPNGFMNATGICNWKSEIQVKRGVAEKSLPNGFKNATWGLEKQLDVRNGVDDGGVGARVLYAGNFLSTAVKSRYREDSMKSL